ncbi:MAG: damage-inducible protein DinB [Aquabacterium sp.]|nr:MAG: damage-inducible protein DinB [Aquabacterium sp.]
MTAPAANEPYALLARYNRWFNERLYEACETLDDAARKLDRGAFFGSIHRTLNHLMLADKLWLRRFGTQPGGFRALTDEVLALPPFTGLDQQLFEDFDAMRAHRVQMDAAVEAFIAELTPAFIAAPMTYQTTKGAPFTQPAWQVLSHVFNHQTHHRGQVTTLLMQAGVDPGPTDLLVITR